MSIIAKLILIFFAVSIIPIAIVAALGLGQATKSIETEVLNDFLLEAKMAESHLLTFFEMQKIRTADWTSEGHIRAETESLAEKEEPKRQEELGAYIKEKKHLLDPTIILTDIFDLEGKIIASTNEERVGHKEEHEDDLEKEYSFFSAKSASFGKAFITGIIARAERGHPSDPMIHVSAPIISLESDRATGVMTNHILLSELNKILSAERPKEFGAKTVSPTSQRRTFEIYLVNREGLMITPSRFVSDAVLKQRVDTEPVRACLQKDEEFTGRYENYRGRSVFGVSLCPKNQFWIMMAEVEEGEILEGLTKLRNQIFLLAVLLGLLVTGVAFLFGQRLIKRVLANVSAVQEIGKGNLEARVKISSRDEIAKVGKGINEMAESLGELTAQQAMLSQAIENIANGVIITNPGPRGAKHKILYVNPAFEKMYGYKASELVGKESPRILKSGKQNEEFYKNLWQTVEASKIFRAEMVNRRKDGSHIDVETIIVPIKDRFGKITQKVGIYYDISGRKNLEKARRSLEELKSKFITIVSHQMRTPLNAIRWNLESILSGQMGKMPAGLEDVLRISKNATAEIISRVGDLVTAIDIEEKRVYLSKEKISLEELLRVVWEELKQGAVLKKIRYAIEYPKKHLPLVEVDPGRMREVLRKLIDNAITYTKEGGEIKMKLEKVNHFLRFGIQDSGIGISQAEQPHIFQRFHRASNAFTMRPDASGLGLYLAKNFIEGHGGKIGFTSKEGKGSMFWFEIPVNR